MKLITFGAALVLAALPAFAQPSNLEINTETPEGQLLEKIGTEEDVTQKVQLLEQFVQQYPNHAAIKWVLAQLPPAYAKLNQPDKSLAACEKMLAKDPTNAAGAHACLKTAEAQKDPELIKKWALLTHDAARKAVAAPKPKFEYEDEEEEWKQTIDFAKQVGTYSEYSLYAACRPRTRPRGLN